MVSLVLNPPPQNAEDTSPPTSLRCLAAPRRARLPHPACATATIVRHSTSWLKRDSPGCRLKLIEF